MSHNLRCVICGKEHKARVDKFPITFHGYAEIRKYPDSNYSPGSFIKREMITKEIEVGHGCKKCNRKSAVREFIKIHKVKQQPGQKLQNAVDLKFKEIRVRKK